MKPKSHSKNLVIGFGKGGKTLAAYLADRGEEVVMIEKSHKMYGGTCINVACIPTKSLIANAEKSVPYGKAVDIKNELTATLRQKNYDKLSKLPSVDVVTGSARFVSKEQIEVALSDSTETVRISAERIFINTGTLPNVPDIQGIDSSRHIFTSTTLMEKSRLPEHLIIVGAGFIGLEFADMYVKFGSKITLLGRGETFLPQEDGDIADAILKVMRAKGIHVVMGASIQSVRDTSRGVAVTYKCGDQTFNEVEGSAVLLATGRKPNVEGLDVAAAGIKLSDKGFITVDDQLRTNVYNIWAIGDINGGPQFTYISLDDFRIIRDQLFEGTHTSRRTRKAFASSVFITPPFAHIGLRETEARNAGRNVKVATLPASAVPRAGILGNTDGVLKSVIDADSNKILGCSLFCVESGEMINTIQVAMNADLDYQVIRDTIFTHPSMTEAFNDLYSGI